MINEISKAIVVIKQGEQGAIGIENNTVINIPAFPVKAINTVGAGDSLNAGFIKAFSQGNDVQNSIRFACATAAVKISQKSFSLDLINSLIKKYV